MISARFATPQEALSVEFLTISKAIEKFQHQYQMPDHASVNRERMPWANGVLTPPEFYASRLWEYPWAISAAELSPGLTCVDIGGGTTPFPLYLREVEETSVIIVDPDVGGLQQDHYLGHGLTHNLIGKANLHVLPESMADISLPDKSVDRVFCISVLEHIESPRVWQNGLREMTRILQHGGRAIITVDLCSGRYFVHPFDIIRYSGLIPVGPIDLRMPTHRFGRMPMSLTDIDVFGMVLEKDESLVSFSLPYERKVPLHEVLLSQTPSSTKPAGNIIRLIIEAIIHPQKAIRWFLNKFRGS